MKKVYIIAEIGPNHNGSFKIAKKYINLISRSGADAIKFQLAKPENVYSLDSYKANYQKKNDGKRSIIEMSKKNQLSQQQHLLLYNYAQKKKIDYLCSAFDLESLVFLVKKIKIKHVKIPSGEVFDYDCLKYLSKIKKIFFLSTGMTNFTDLKKILSILNKNFKKKIILLHCVSSYPTSPKQANLSRMLELKKLGYNIGYSDHTRSNCASLAAVAMGAKVIEKHVTLNQNLKGPDHKFSSNIKDFFMLVKDIREIEDIIKIPKKVFDKNIFEIKNVARKSIVSKSFIKRNSTINRRNIAFKRPGTGISPLDLKKVLGKIAKVNIEKNRVIKKNMLKW